jgi:hypothetical protein
MKRSVAPPKVSQSKLDQIKSGKQTKTQIGVEKEKKKVIHGVGAKYAIEEKEKKFEESGVTRKKRNYVMYQSKLGTEKEQNLQIFKEAKKPKPKPTREVKPRKDEKIFQTKKKLEYLDNYQYHETKDIKDNDPRKVSVVTHQRLGDIVGGTYEVSTYHKQTITDPGRGPKLYSSKTSKTTVRKNVAGQPTGKTTKTTTTNTSNPYRTTNTTTTRTTKTTTTKPFNVGRTNKTTTTKTTTKTTQRSNSASKYLPRRGGDTRNNQREVKKFSSYTNIRAVPKNQTKSKSPAPGRAKFSTTKKTTTKTTTRTQSAGRGRRH